jgi:Chemoreceptor zinc-binding domain
MGAEKIEAALKAHSEWFVRLRMAVEERSSKFDPDMVAKDNQCEFGKWLYHDFPKEWQGLPIFKEIMDIHKQFHIEAGRILRLALASKKEEALTALGVGSVIRKVSAELVGKLYKLKAMYAG